jgi:nucleoside-diphosphate-sugar epimerase
VTELSAQVLPPSEKVYALPLYQPREPPWREEEWDAAQEMHFNYFGIGWTKLYIEKMCEFFRRLGVTKHTLIRHTNVFGPHDKFDLQRSHVFGATVTKAMTSQTGGIAVCGTGEEARDLLYVDDLVRFVKLAIERQLLAYEMLHASAGYSIKIKKWPVSPKPPDGACASRARSQRADDRHVLRSR